MKLDEHLPLDHHLGQVYRFGAGLIGSFLLAFGIAGLVRAPDPISRTGILVFGLSTDGLLSGISVLVGLILVVAAWIGGNVASVTNIVFGLLFLLNGAQGLALLRTSLNVMAFDVRNVIFSYLVGLALLLFGIYGRVSGGLTPENPYQRARRQASREEARQEQHRLDELADLEASVEHQRHTTGGPGQEQPPHPW